MASPSTIDTLTSALVARFLRNHHFSDTLEAFVREAGLPLDVGQGADGINDWTIQSLIEEKKTYDQTAKFERYGQTEKQSTLWTEPAPSKAVVVQMPTSANPLAVSVEQWQSPSDDDTQDPAAGFYIVSTGSDKQVHLLNTEEGNESATSFPGVSDSPVLSLVSILQGRYILMTNMSGKLILLCGHQTLDTRKDHAKYAVKVAVYQDRKNSSKWWVATAGWDQTVLLYCLNIPENNATTLRIGQPVARIKLISNPESLLFVPHIDTNELLLLVSRRDSTSIHYYQVEVDGANTDAAREGEPREAQLLGQQNLAPHSNTWVAFSPAHMALSPNDPGLLAVATSTLPHLKVMIVRLLFPKATADKPDSTSMADQMTQASQAMANLAIQNREDAAILVQANTFASQTAYSTPQLAWRPDGSGVWVTGDDGVVRGVETKTGKVVALLKGGHEPGCKVRSVWSGYVDVPQQGGHIVREEWVISGAFDKRVIVWKV
ncbi:unnamed protein product [Penicillium olsonii]|nr:unnamed protein product [Penicillium olsonii]